MAEDQENDKPGDGEMDEALKPEGSEEQREKSGSPASEERRENEEPSEIEKKDKQIKELTETVKRTQAEFENFRKRIERENRMFLDYAKEDLIRKLIPLLENIRLAEDNKNNKDEFIKGAELIFNQLREILKAEGLQEIDCLGQKFDPNMHEALLRVESDKDDHVEQEIQKGYMLNDKVLVHPKVAVGKKDDKKGDEKGGDTEDS